MTGLRFGRLTVTRPAPPGNTRGARWYCDCDCGSDDLVVWSRNLLSRAKPKTSCGCASLRPLSQSRRAVKNRAYRRYRDTVGRRLVPVLGAQRRVEALQAQGWPGRWLSAKLGWREQRLQTLLCHQKYVNRSTYQAICRLYDQLWDQRPPMDTPGHRQSVARTVRWAARRGFAPPLAWDDDTIDDPQAKPLHRLNRQTREHMEGTKERRQYLRRQRKAA